MENKSGSMNEKMFSQEMILKEQLIKKITKQRMKF